MKEDVLKSQIVISNSLPREREQAWEGLQEIVERAWANARRSGLSPEEIEREIAAARREARAGTSQASA